MTPDLAALVESARHSLAEDADLEPAIPERIRRLLTPANSREAYVNAFELIGGVARLAEWGDANLSEFYRLHSRTVAQEHTGAGGAPLTILLTSYVSVADSPQPQITVSPQPAVPAPPLQLSLALPPE